MKKFEKLKFGIGWLNLFYSLSQFSNFIALTGQASAASFIFSPESSEDSITSAFPSSPSLKVLGAMATQVPQPIQLSLSTLTLAIFLQKLC